MNLQDGLSRDEAELLLYVADELDPARRLALDARLAAEPALRRKLADYAAIDGVLRTAHSDSTATAFLSERALKSSLRLVREQVLVMNQASTAARAPFRVPPYAVAAGIAIMFTLGFLAWLYTTPQTAPLMPPTATNTNGNGLVRTGPFGGTGFGYGGLTRAFGPIGVEQYADTSQQIDQEIDALTMLSDFDEADANP